MILIKCIPNVCIFSKIQNTLISQVKPINIVKLSKTIVFHLHFKRDDLIIEYQI